MQVVHELAVELQDVVPAPVDPLFDEPRGDLGRGARHFLERALHSRGALIRASLAGLLRLALEIAQRGEPLLVRRAA